MRSCLEKSSSLAKSPTEGLLFGTQKQAESRPWLQASTSPLLCPRPPPLSCPCRARPQLQGRGHSQLTSALPQPQPQQQGNNKPLRSRLTGSQTLGRGGDRGAAAAGGGQGAGPRRPEISASQATWLRPALKPQRSLAV